MRHVCRDLAARKVEGKGGRRTWFTVTKIGLLSEPIITTRTYVIKATAASRREVGETGFGAGMNGCTISSRCAIIQGDASARVCTGGASWVAKWGSGRVSIKVSVKGNVEKSI
jgi:hypothetical protein